MLVEDIFLPIYEKFCWNAQKGFGSFITFDFGEPLLNINEKDRVRNGVKEHIRRVHVRGAWHLWIYLCDWTIIAHSKTIATESSKTRDIHRATNRLNGQKLVRVEIQADSSTIFSFELGDQLITRPNQEAYGLESEQWLFFEPSGLVFTLRADGKYAYHHGSTKPENEIWCSM